MLSSILDHVYTFERDELLPRDWPMNEAGTVMVSMKKQKQTSKKWKHWKHIK